MLLPNADQGILDRRAEIVSALKSMLPAGCVIDDDKSMSAFDTDGLSAYRNQPLVVVLPETTQQVADVMRWCRDNAVKIVPRGAGTSLSGGAIPLSDGVLLGLGK
ncbi:MAG: FAD-binding protein, partial [Pseudomonadota bacterium]|nr:FAD-binding protein [Pseudomonadota bacterium]